MSVGPSSLKLDGIPGLKDLFGILPWPSISESLAKASDFLSRFYTSEGVYETLSLEATLELHDPEGKRATYRKIKKVRYLQDNIIAFQDYAWGDGEILVNYRTNKGKPVDWYRSGYKTYVLLSLREVKNRGDIDEFPIECGIRRGFLTKDEYWGTDIGQRTGHLKVKILFPKVRPLLLLSLEKNIRQKARMLKCDDIKQLYDGRLMV